MKLEVGDLSCSSATSLDGGGYNEYYNGPQTRQGGDVGGREHNLRSRGV